MRGAALIVRGAGFITGSLFVFLLHTIPAAAADPPPPVRFVSWNLRNYLGTSPQPDSASPPAGNTRPKPAAEVAAVTRILASLNPDILGVCEMGGPPELAALRQRLKDAGLDLPHSELVEAADRERHLALLSRYPISSRQPQTKGRYLLDESLLPVQRGFLDVSVAVPGHGELRFIGVHLKSRRDVPEGGEDLMRRNEAHLLRGYIDSVLTTAPETKLLVYGDFNATRDEPAVKAAAGIRGSLAALTPVVPADATGQRWTYYYPEADTYSRIDFVLASKQLNPDIDDGATMIYSGADWSAASDHRALLTVIDPHRKKKKPAPAADDD